QETRRLYPLPNGARRCALHPHFGRLGLPTSDDLFPDGNPIRSRSKRARKFPCLYPGVTLLRGPLPCFAGESPPPSRSLSTNRSVRRFSPGGRRAQAAVGD